MEILLSSVTEPALQPEVEVVPEIQVAQGAVKHARGNGSGEHTSQDWRHRAACRDWPNPEAFFPVGNTGSAIQEIDDAKKVCAGCSVADKCLEFALNMGIEWGIYGGLSEDELKAKQKERRAAAKAKALLLKERTE